MDGRGRVWVAMSDRTGVGIGQGAWTDYVANWESEAREVRKDCVGTRWEWVVGVGGCGWGGWDLDRVGGGGQGVGWGWLIGWLDSYSMY